ncbi:MAG: cobalt-precorrin 5A hydrolase [Peptococcaceae bacterium]|nr:cobalt-precorrin 5A hydrolase [Peptococcaceae bacterium]
MKVAVVAVTGKGTRLGLKVAGALRSEGHEVSVFTLPELAREIDGAAPLDGPLGLVMGDFFAGYRGLVMIMALGIVVRTIAPHVRDKRTDPAVVVMDEGGGFAISVLSGHVGGANDLARMIAGKTGCTAVITTATDAGGVPAVDVLARDFQLAPEPFSAVKKVNAALARGERVVIYTEHCLPIPESESLAVRPWAEAGDDISGWRVLVTGRAQARTGEKTLLLRPRNLVAGVGCKRGVEKAGILDEINRALESAGRSSLCLRALATIGARTSERGLVEAARELGVPLLGFGTGELNGAMERFGLRESNRVKDRMGVGGVCEPAAMLACPKGRLLAPKRKGDGVTVALAEEESGWWESDPGPLT